MLKRNTEQSGIICTFPPLQVLQPGLSEKRVESAQVAAQVRKQLFFSFAILIRFYSGSWAQPRSYWPEMPGRRGRKIKSQFSQQIIYSNVMMVATSNLRSHMLLKSISSCSTRQVKVVEDCSQLLALGPILASRFLEQYIH